jgi:hypothetical protein
MTQGDNWKAREINGPAKERRKWDSVTGTRWDKVLIRRGICEVQKMVDRDGRKGLLITNSLENGRENGKTANNTELFFLLDGFGGSISKRPGVMMRNLPFRNSFESEREW